MVFSWWRNFQRYFSRKRSRSPRPAPRPTLETLEDRRLLATFTVFNTLDDLNPGSLRREILDSNATPGPNTILFRIGSGVQVIQPASPLPAITNPVTLAGYYQPGYNGNPLIVLDGSNAGATSGLNLAAGSSGSEVDSLVIDHFASAGILIQSDNNHIYGDYVGTDATGTGAAGNAIGVDIQGGKDNTIGEGVVLIPAILPQPPDLLLSGYDVLSGNTLYGLRISGSGATGNLVQGNFLGTNANGMIAIPNGGAGVVLDGSSANTIGSSTVGGGNVISGNGDFGVYLVDGASNNAVAYNAIGTTGNLKDALPNGYDGVFLDGAADNTIGRPNAGSGIFNPAPGNLIAGNGRFGVFLLGSGTTGNAIQNNLIGLDGAGVALPNGADGVALFSGAAGNTIGGATPGADNVISGNGRFGVFLTGSGTSGNVVQDNLLGTNVTGTDVLSGVVGGNDSGVAIFTGADGNTIGGTAPGASNLIANNRDYGIEIVQASANVVQANYIGTNASDSLAVSNGQAGIFLEAAPANTIGGTSATARNVISDNGFDEVALITPDSTISGIILQGAGTTGNVVQGNFIGTEASGTVALPNGGDGVFLFSGADNNTIGGTAPGAGNLISGNGTGLEIAGASGNIVQGNLIGTAAGGMAALPSPLAYGHNQSTGVLLDSAASGNTVGGTTAAARNVISGNSYLTPDSFPVSTGYVPYGFNIVLEDSGTTGNVVEGNFIGTNAAGTAALSPPSEAGIRVAFGAADNTLGGLAPGAGNVVSGNVVGIDVDGSGTSGNLIQGNNIGTDASGTRAVPNQGDGILVASQVTDTIIGGTAAGAGNVISGNGPSLPDSFFSHIPPAEGIQLGDDGGNGPTSGTLIQGNFIGTDRSGTLALGNTGDGISIYAPLNTTYNATANTVGGTVAGAGNVIANNGGAGVIIPNTTGSNPILGNSIYDNSGLGIELGPYGVTMNTPGGPHAGPNELQNYPVLNSVMASDGGLDINVSLNSTPSHTFRLEFFANAAADPSGHGQGQTFLGAANVTTDGNGNVTQTVHLDVSLPTGQNVLSATATDLATGDTSEFAADVPLAA